MEDMEESRRILEAHDWDLLNAISRHMGFEQIPDRSQLQPPSSSASARAPPVVQDESVAVQRRRILDTPNGNEPGNNSPGLLGWIWRLITAPVDILFRYIWDFIGYGLRFLQQDPRRGMRTFTLALLIPRLNINVTKGSCIILAITDPVQDVVNFITKYEATYGSIHPPFYQVTFQLSA